VTKRHKVLKRYADAEPRTKLINPSLEYRPQLVLSGLVQRFCNGSYRSDTVGESNPRQRRRKRTATGRDLRRVGGGAYRSPLNMNGMLHMLDCRSGRLGTIIALSPCRKVSRGQTESSSRQDSFGHARLGGAAPLISNLISSKLACRCHWAVPDYLLRSARHIASETDVQQAYAVGRAAVEFAIAGKSAVMPAIRRLSDVPYRWDIVAAPLAEVANPPFSQSGLASTRYAKSQARPT
jgi:hypothetical protein